MRTRLVLLGGQTIALGLMMAFLVVPASSLFLVEYGADKLAFVYLAVAGSGVAVTSAMARAGRRWSLSRLALTLLVCYAVAVSAAWLLLVFADATWVTFPLLVMFPLSIPLGFVIVGASAGRLLDLQQMKAYFPRVVAGFSVGFAIGGLLAAWLARTLGDVAHLLVLDVAAAALFIGLVVETGRRHPAQLRSRPDQTPARSDTTRRAGGGGILRNHLVRLVFGYQLLSAAVTQLLDFMVWERAALRYPDADDLAAFLGYFGAIINVVSVGFVVLIAGRLLSRFGIRLGLAANPLGVIVVLAGVIIVGFIGGGPASLAFFVLVCAAQVTDISLTDGTTRTSINATYQALRSVVRLRAQTWVEAAGVPLALGFVGAYLLLFDALDLGILALAVSVAAMSIAWLVFAVLAYREYGRDLHRTFARRDWDPTALQVDDEASRAVLEGLLESEDIRDVRLGLDVLSDAGSPLLLPCVARLISDPDSDRKQLGVEMAARLGDRDLVPNLLGVVVDGETPGQVRALAVRVATSLGADADAFGSALADPNVAVRVAAAAAVAQSDSDLAQRARSVCVEALLAPDDATVEAGLVDVAYSPHPAYADAVFAIARRPSPPKGWAEALAAHVRFLQLDRVTLLDLAAENPTSADRLVEAMGRSRDESACALLAGLCVDGDHELAEAASRALAGSGFRMGAATVAQLAALEVARATRAAAAAQAFADQDGAEHLVRALDDEIADSSWRVQNALGLAHGTDWLEHALGQLGSSVDGERALAIETLEVDLGHRTAGYTLDLLDPNVDASQRRQRLASRDDAPVADPEDWLTEFLDDPAEFWQEGWLMVCALHATAVILPDQGAGRGRQHRDDPDPVVAQTALWLLAGHANAGR
ncbi:MAG: hypothetical protein ABWZ26_07845 [Candidatus Nanopelagicales bacterium]